MLDLPGKCTPPEDKWQVDGGWKLVKTGVDCGLGMQG